MSSGCCNSLYCICGNPAIPEPVPCGATGLFCPSLGRCAMGCAANTEFCCGEREEEGREGTDDEGEEIASEEYSGKGEEESEGDMDMLINDSDCNSLCADLPDFSIVSDGCCTDWGLFNNIKITFIVFIMTELYSISILIIY